MPVIPRAPAPSAMHQSRPYILLGMGRVMRKSIEPSAACSTDRVAKRSIGGEWEVIRLYRHDIAGPVFSPCCTTQFRTATLAGIYIMGEANKAPVRKNSALLIGERSLIRGHRPGRLGHGRIRALRPGRQSDKSRGLLFAGPADASLSPV